MADRYISYGMVDIKFVMKTTQRHLVHSWKSNEIEIVNKIDSK